MKNLIIFIGLSFVFCISAFAQNSSPCPTVSVSGPEDLVRPNENMSFTAKVEGINLEKVRYLWTVSNGTIVSGQGTLFLKVLPTDLVEPITATLDITGLPDNCTKSASASVAISGPTCFASKKLDEFSLQPPRIRKDRIDYLINELNNDPTAIAYILEQFTRNITRTQIEQKVNNIFTAFKFRKYPIDQVKLFIAKGSETLTTYWISPQGAPMPSLGDDSVEINANTYKQDLAKIFAQKRKKN